MGRITADGKRKYVPSSTVVQEDPVTPNMWNHENGTPFLEPNLIVPYGVNITKRQMSAHPRYQPIREDGLWNDTNKVLYNGWLRIPLTPMRTLNFITIMEMDIEGPVRQMLANIGLDPPRLSGYVYYKELSYQFLASIELHHEPGITPSVQTAFITFVLRGQVYKLKMRKLCKALGFEPTKSGSKVPRIDIQPLWTAIGSSIGPNRERKLTLIKNPAIRIVAKILGTHLMGKEEAGSLSRTEMTLLYYGLPRDVRSAIYTAEAESLQPPTLETNLGYLFAEMLMEKKSRGLQVNKEKTEHIACTLTPIFKAAKVNLYKEEARGRCSKSMNQRHLQSIQFLRDNRYCYQYTRSDGEQRAVNLPLPYKLGIDTLEAVKFEIPEHLQIVIPSPRRRQFGSSAIPHPPTRPTTSI